jgi:hypothetical protein
MSAPARNAPERDSGFFKFLTFQLCLKNFTLSLTVLLSYCLLAGFPDREILVSLHFPPDQDSSKPIADACYHFESALQDNMFLLLDNIKTLLDNIKTLLDNIKRYWITYKSVTG